MLYAPHSPSGLKAMAIAGLLLLAGCGPSSERGTPSSKPASSVTRAVRPRPLPVELKFVYRAILAGRYERARELANEYLETHPGEAQANLMIGLSHLRADNMGAARPYFELALARDPDGYIAHDYLAQAHFMLGDLPSARRHYELYRSFAPSEPKTYTRLGVIDLEEGQLDRAAAHFERALELFEALKSTAPRLYESQRAELAKVHARLGDMHFSSGDYATARDELLEATRLWPANISSFFTLSLVYQRLGETRLAGEARGRYDAARRTLLESQSHQTR